MKQIVFNDKAADFFNSENEKTLDNVAVTIVHKDILKEKDKEIDKLNNKYNKALELLADFNMLCEYDEGKIPDNYCEENCDVDDEIYKKCWDKYIELELKGDSSNE